MRERKINIVAESPMYYFKIDKLIFFFQPTQLYVVPSLMLFMTSHPSVKPEYLATVKEIVSGAAPSTKSLIANFKNKFYLSKITIRQGNYGRAL